MSQPLHELDTPQLLIDLDRVERNIARMADACATAGVALRPHVKTSKCWPIASRQLDAGAIGFTCSTPAEVAWLQARGVRDLLWAHAPIGPRKVAFAVAAASRGGLTVTLDSAQAASALSEAAEQAGVTIPFVLEVNTGHARLGVDPDAAVSTAARIATLPGLILRGVMTHEGHLYGVPDRAERASVGRTAGRVLVDVAQSLRRAGHDAHIVSVGSTPGAASAPFVDGVTEARPGTYVYGDGNQVGLGSAALDDCALTVLTRVVGTERHGRAIIDAGTKSMSSDSFATAASYGRVCNTAAVLVPDVEFAESNEEHGFLIGRGTAALELGDLLRIVPHHACSTTNMWSRAHAVRGDQVGDVWNIEARH